MLGVANQYGHWHYQRIVYETGIARSTVSSPASGHQQAHATEKTQPYVTNACPKDESPVDFPLVHDTIPASSQHHRLEGFGSLTSNGMAQTVGVSTQIFT
jgi:hypothetical protein